MSTIEPNSLAPTSPSSVGKPSGDAITSGGLKLEPGAEAIRGSSGPLGAVVPDARTTPADALADIASVTAPPAQRFAAERAVLAANFRKDIQPTAKAEEYIALLDQTLQTSTAGTFDEVVGEFFVKVAKQYQQNPTIDNFRLLTQLSGTLFRTCSNDLPVVNALLARLPNYMSIDSDIENIEMKLSLDAALSRSSITASELKSAYVNVVDQLISTGQESNAIQLVFLVTGNNNQSVSAEILNIIDPTQSLRFFNGLESDTIELIQSGVIPPGKPIERTKLLTDFPEVEPYLAQLCVDPSSDKLTFIDKPYDDLDGLLKQIYPDQGKRDQFFELYRKNVGGYDYQNAKELALILGDHQLQVEAQLESYGRCITLIAQAYPDNRALQDLCQEAGLVLLERRENYFVNIPRLISKYNNGSVKSFDVILLTPELPEHAPSKSTTYGIVDIVAYFKEIKASVLLVANSLQSQLKSNGRLTGFRTSDIKTSDIPSLSKIISPTALARRSLVMEGVAAYRDLMFSRSKNTEWTMEGTIDGSLKPGPGINCISNSFLFNAYILGVHSTADGAQTVNVGGTSLDLTVQMQRVTATGHERIEKGRITLRKTGSQPLHVTAEMDRQVIKNGAAVFICQAYKMVDGKEETAHSFTIYNDGEGWMVCESTPPKPRIIPFDRKMKFASYTRLELVDITPDPDTTYVVYANRATAREQLQSGTGRPLIADAK